MAKINHRSNPRIQEDHDTAVVVDGLMVSRTVTPELMAMGSLKLMRVNVLEGHVKLVTSTLVPLGLSSAT